MSDKRKLILDCDPGTDDSVCIVMALTQPDLELLAITTESGNLPADKTSANARRILEYMGRTDIPVAQGRMKPMLRDYPKDPYSHGADGLGNHFFPEPKMPISDKSPANLIVELVKANPGEVSLVCTSCLTNIAIAFLSNPEIIPMVKELIHIGGSYGITEYAFRNATGDNPMSEWNVYVDPEAADIVYGSGAKLFTIGLDVAFNPEWVNILPETIAKLEKVNSVSSRYALDIIDYVDKNNSLPDLFNNGPIDTVAMCSVINHDIIRTKEINVAVDTSDNQLTQIGRAHV